MTSPAPNRSQRQQCYDAREAYYACLDKHGIVNPGDEGGNCATEVKQFQKICAASWVEHFNKRRAFEAHRAAALAADEARSQERK